MKNAPPTFCDRLASHQWPVISNQSAPPPDHGSLTTDHCSLITAHGSRLNRHLCSLCFLLLTFLFTLPASAHVQQGEAAGFVTGLRHPWSGLDHVLAMVAVGIWGAQLGAPAIWLLPVTFPMVMAFGGFLGLIGVHLPGVEFGIAASALLLGIMVCVEARPKLIWAAVLVGAFGLYHGHAHGTELPAGQSGMLYSMGFVIATGCLHAIGIALGLIRPLPAGRWGLRAAGACIAMMGVFFLWRAFS
jgi:urease accessory protein